MINRSESYPPGMGPSGSGATLPQDRKPSVAGPASESDETPDDLGARNACKLCTPLGACLAFRGVEGCVPFLHGSQGCSTYIRRYLISHFREPVDIASSNFHEDSAVFGGAENFQAGVRNVVKQYRPKIVGVATTCLAETIGEDMPRMVRGYFETAPKDSPPIVRVSTASYRGTHMDGFHSAVAELADQLAEAGPAGADINLFPGMVSPADLRHLKEIFEDFPLPLTLLPDYSDTMDGGVWSEYQPLQEGGTPVKKIIAMGSHRASIEFGSTLPDRTAGTILREKFGIPHHRLPVPIGVQASDRFFELLETLSEKPVPARHLRERARLLDAYVDGHKYVSGKRAVVFGEEDMVAALTGFLCEIGIVPVICASGGRSGKLEEAIRAAAPDLPDETVIRDRCDFTDIAGLARDLSPHLFLGNSKGYSVARQMALPLVRVGFPIHDRLGAQRIHLLGYRGTLELFDRLVNALIESKQETSSVGYSYV